MTRPVTVNITGKQGGLWTICPFTYEAGAGLQLYPDGTMVRYQVPLYIIEVTGGGKFKAVRFGLVNHREKSLAPVRTCDAGLAKARTVQSEWIPTYSPHSFTLPGRPGAWRIHHGFLIHQGSDEKGIGGSLGCVEIVGHGQWDSFLLTIEKQSGANCAALSKARALTINVEAAAFPKATLITP